MTEHNWYLCTESRLEQQFSDHIAPFWQEHVTLGSFQGNGDISVSYAYCIPEQAKHSVLISSGRIESLLKYKEVIYELYRNGFAVFVLDHRGQGLSGRMTKMLGPTRTAMIGLGFTTLGMFMFSGAIYGWMAYAVLIFASLGGVAGPATQQLMTGVTPKNAQGELQGALASVQSLTQTIIGPLLMTGTLSYFSQPDAPVHFKGANFFLAGILAALAFIPFMAGVRANREEVQHIDEDARHADDEVETEPPVEQTAT